MPKAEQDFILLPDGFHIWGDSSRLSGVPSEIVEKQSSGYALYPMDNPAWRKISTDTMMVIGDVPDEALKTLAVTAEKLEEMLQREIGGPARRYIYTIKIFKDRNQFCAYARRCGAANALSFYEPNKGELVVHFSQQTDAEDFERTFAHEFTHAYMHRVYGVMDPIWFAEGMAEYFSRLEWTRKGFKPTGKSENAAMHGETVSAIPLIDILKATRDDIYGMKFPEYYAASWAVVSFLLKKHPELVESILLKNIVDLEPLQQEYRRFLKQKLGV